MDKSINDNNSGKFLNPLKFFKNLTTILLFIAAASFIIYAFSPLISNLFGKSAHRLIEASSLGFTIRIYNDEIKRFPDAYFTIAYLSSCAAILITTLIIAVIRSILKDILNSGAPFTKSIPKKIKLIAIIILAYAILTWVMQSAAYFVLTNNEFLSFKTPGIKFASSVNLNFTALFVSGLIYLLSFIFEYGLHLKEDNESII